MMLLPPPAPSRALIGQPRRPSAALAPPPRWRPCSHWPRRPCITSPRGPLPPAGFLMKSSSITARPRPPPALPGRPAALPLARWGRGYSPACARPSARGSQPPGQTPYERQGCSTLARLPGPVPIPIGYRSCQSQGRGYQRTRQAPAAGRLAVEKVQGAWSGDDCKHGPWRAPLAAIRELPHSGPLVRAACLCACLAQAGARAEAGSR